MKHFLHRSAIALAAATTLGIVGSTSSIAAATRPRPAPTTTRATVPTTTVAPGPVAAPTGLRILQTATSGPTEVSVIWNPPTDFVYYTVFLNGASAPNATCSGQPYCFGNDAISATFRGLTPGTTYRMYVVANRYPAYGGGSAASAEFVFTTPRA